MTSSQDSMWHRVAGVLRDPYRRCRHAKFIHAVRVALGILVAFGVTSGFGIPHGVWTPVSMLIVIAGLQHHGTIRERAVQRSFGTMVGVAAGLFVIVQQKYLGCAPLTWALMAAFCGVCAYYAVGRGGYMAILSAITLVIVAGLGNGPMEEGLWRAINVLLGIAIALLLSFTLPIYATWAWRYEFAEMLRRCEAVYAGMARGETPPAAGQLRKMAAINAELLQLRSFMPAIVQESGLSKDWLEGVQRRLRIFISLTEIAFMRPHGVVGEEARGICLMLATLARALESGSPECLADGAAPADLLPVDGTALLPDLRALLEQIRQQLTGAPRLWAV